MKPSPKRKARSITKAEIITIPSKRYEEAKAMLPQRLYDDLYDMVEEYKFAALKIHGAKLNSPRVVAQLILMGWRSLPFNDTIKFDLERNLRVDMTKRETEMSQETRTTEVKAFEIWWAIHCDSLEMSSAVKFAAWNGWLAKLHHVA